MTDTKQFWDKAAPKYAKDPIKDMEAYEYTLGRTKSYLKPDHRVLEIGCGTGSTALLVAQYVKDMLGTDISSAMVDIARSKAEAEGAENLHFSVSNAQDAAKTQGTFDAVLGFNVFHLVQGAEGIFADIHQRLPKGGYFISKTPCLGDPSVGFKRFLFKAMIPPMQWIGKAPFVRFLTHAELEHAITAAGFEIVESGNFPSISRYIVARRL